MPPLFMTHPDSPDHAPAVTTQNAYDKVWAGKGWKLVDDKEAAELQAAADAPPPDPNQLAGQALDDALKAAGVSGSGLTADEKRTALAAHYAGQGS